MCHPAGLGKAPELKQSDLVKCRRPALADLTAKWSAGIVDLRLYQLRHRDPLLQQWLEVISTGLVVPRQTISEFRLRRSRDNLKAAIAVLEIPYAVAQDNDGAPGALSATLLADLY
jgi:hypothetical protein